MEFRVKINDPHSIVMAEENKKKRVFLGGTCGESKWREKLILKLEIDYFNPVVENWTEACMAEEIKQRKNCDYVLYVITPNMEGVYSIAEVVDDSNKRPEKTVFCFLKKDKKGEEFGMSYDIVDKEFTQGQLKSLKQVEKMVEENGAKVCSSLKDVASYLNG
jgi:hypothetical protein